jgi:hypothetical protein
MQECGQKVGAAFVADRQPSVGDQPGQRPFHFPSLSAQPRGGLHPTAGDPRSDAAAADRLPAGRVVIAFVGVQLGRAPARSTGSSPWPDDCWDGVHQLLQQQRVVGVGRRQADSQRDPGGIDQQVVLGARLAPVDRIGAGQFPPRRARMLTESIDARDQSTCPSSPSQSSSR